MNEVRVKSRFGWTRATIMAAVALLLGTALIAGCGSTATVDPVARAAYVSSQEAGVKFTLAMHLSSSVLPEGFSISGSGYASQGGHARMNMDLSGIPGATGLPAGGHGVEAVFLYPTVYMRMPFLTDKLPEGKSWLQIDMSKVVQATGGAMPQALGIGQIDPSEMLQYLKTSSGHVQTLGTTQLYGVSTTHYRVKLQLATVLQKLPGSERAAAKTLLQHVGNAGAIPIDVWVDGKGRVRRVQMSLDIAGATASGAATVTVGFTEYGTVPVVAAPPESEVVNLTSLLSKGLASGLSG